MSKKPDIWMPLYIADYLADSTHLNTEQHGAYLLLLMAAWMRGGQLPDDDDQLSAIARLDASKWRKHGPILRAFFRPDNGLLVQGRLMAEYENAIAFKEKQRGNGKLGGRPKKQKPADEKTQAFSLGSVSLSENGDLGNPNQSQQKAHHHHQLPSTSTYSAQPEIPTTPEAPMPALVPTTGTEAGRACRLMRQAGCVTVNPGHPDLLDALAAGVTPEALADTVAEAIQAGKTKPFSWAIATARGRLEEAGRRLAAPGQQRPRVVLGLADQVMQTYHDNQRRKLAHERND